MSLNKVQIIGHLGADPEIRYTAQESAVATFNVATSRSWRDKKTNEKKEATEWHRVIFWNRLAEVAGEYLRKGSHIYVEGALKTRKYEDKNGVERYVTEIIGQRLDMLGGKPKEDKNAMPNASTQSNEPPHIDEDGLLDIDQFDDDIPF